MLKVVVLTVNLYLNMYVLDPFLWQKKNHLHVFTYNYKKHQTHASLIQSQVLSKPMLYYDCLNCLILYLEYFVFLSETYHIISCLHICTT